jgi:hypothetical protein
MVALSMDMGASGGGRFGGIMTQGPHAATCVAARLDEILEAAVALG